MPASPALKNRGYFRGFRAAGMPCLFLAFYPCPIGIPYSENVGILVKICTVYRKSTAVLFFFFKSVSVYWNRDILKHTGSYHKKPRYGTVALPQVLQSPKIHRLAYLYETTVRFRGTASSLTVPEDTPPYIPVRNHGTVPWALPQALQSPRIHHLISLYETIKGYRDTASSLAVPEDTPSYTPIRNHGTVRFRGTASSLTVVLEDTPSYFTVRNHLRIP